jgi:hypothetical protein
MADFEIKNRADFQNMVDAQIEETLTLEYKASPALSRNSKDVQELCKDVSAMTNSAGGQIIYGVEEDKRTHKPTKVDDGVTDDKITREWIVQVLQSNVHPRIENLKVQRISLSENGYGFVISVEPTLIGPHQAPDNKYYKRFELHAVPMEDYEIRDIFRRSTTPDLEATLSFAGKDTFFVEFPQGTERSRTFFVECAVSNRSPIPVYYAIVEVSIDRQLIVPFQAQSFRQTGTVKALKNGAVQWLNVYRRTIMSPPGVPIFKEGIHEDHKDAVPVELPALLAASSDPIYFETNVQAPGFSRREGWVMHSLGGGKLKLHRSGG